MSKATFKKVMADNKVTAVAKHQLVDGEDKVTYKFKAVGPKAKQFFNLH